MKMCRHQLWSLGGNSKGVAMLRVRRARPTFGGLSAIASGLPVSWSVQSAFNAHWTGHNVGVPLAMADMCADLHCHGGCCMAPMNRPC